MSKWHCCPWCVLRPEWCYRYLSEVLRTDRKIKLQDVGFPPPWNDYPASLIYVVKKEGGGQRKEKTRAGVQASSHAAGKITETLEAAWLWCGGPLTYTATILSLGGAAHRKAPTFCCMTQRVLQRQPWMFLLSNSELPKPHSWRWRNSGSHFRLTQSNF